MNYGADSGPPTRKRPLVCYSENCNQRAVLISAATGKPMPPSSKKIVKRRRTGASSAAQRQRRRRVGTVKRKQAPRGGRQRPGIGGARSKVRIVKGKVSIHVAGFPGVQRIGAGQLLRFVPQSRLRLAAKRALGGGFRRRRPIKGGKKRRQMQETLEDSLF
jgi:plasmid stabilization system protein ParE